MFFPADEIKDSIRRGEIDVLVSDFLKDAKLDITEEDLKDPQVREKLINMVDNVPFM